MKQSVERCKVTCSVGFLLLTAGLIYLDGVNLFAQVMISCLVHEVGHYAAARGVGSRVCFLRLTAVGAEMELDPSVHLSYLSDALLVFAGPMANLAAAWVAVKLGLNLFAGLNLCFGILNLLPVCPLDGGRLLIDILSLLNPVLAERVHAVISVLFCGALLGLGWTAWRRWGNLSLLFVALWLIAGRAKE